MGFTLITLLQQMHDLARFKRENSGADLSKVGVRWCKRCGYKHGSYVACNLKKDVRTSAKGHAVIRWVQRDAA